MADKEQFFRELSEALNKRGISEVEIKPYLDSFERFYDRMLNDNQKTSNILNNVEDIADNIAAQIKDREEEISKLTQRTMTVDAVHIEDSEAKEGLENSEMEAGDDASQNKITNVDFNDAMKTVQTDVVADITADEYISAEEITGVSSEIIQIDEDYEGDMEEALFQDDGLKEEADGGATRLPDYEGEAPAPNSKTFWIILCASLPLTIPAALLLIGAFLLVFVLLVALICGAFAGLVGVASLGAIASLIGIIYGSAQLFVSLAIGLYEIGVGVTAIGIALFVGILLYNFAIRLVPILMRLEWKLFKYTLKKLKVFLNYVRRECAKI